MDWGDTFLGILIALTWLIRDDDKKEKDKKSIF